MTAVEEPSTDPTLAAPDDTPTLEGTPAGTTARDADATVTQDDLTEGFEGDPHADPLDEHHVFAPPRPAPRRPGLIPTDIADAIAPVLTRAVADIRAHEDGSRRGGDIEDVHKMRVATRRIRAYLKAARPALDRGAADRLRSDLRELAGTLGVIRDLDVMIDLLHKEAARLGDPDTGALEHLIARLDAERVTARDQLVTELDDQSYADLLAELDEASEEPPVADPWADLHGLAAQEWRTLEKAQRRLHKRFGTDPPDDDLHELRIYGKRARYAAELIPHERAIDRFLSALADFQEVLGNHQDACVLEDRLRELVDETQDPHSGIAAGRVIQGGRDRRAAARAAYPTAWAKVRAAAHTAMPS